MAPSFPDPVVLVHSLQTGLVSPRPRSVQRLLKSIKEDMVYIRDISRDIPVAVTWDASINSCANEGQSDCSVTGQLSQAIDAAPRRSDDEGILNDYTENFGLDVLEELDKADIAAWFFRTAKVHSGLPETDSEDPRRLIKRKVRRPEEAISGNDFLSIYRHGMFNKKTFATGRKHKKGIAPVVLGLGAAAAAGGAGALGWWFWDDIKKTVTDLAKSFQTSKEEVEIKKPSIEAIRAEKPATGRSSAVELPVGRRPSSSVEPSGSSSRQSGPPGQSLVEADAPIFDFPFAEFPELDYNDEILPVQPYRNIKPSTVEGPQLPSQPQPVLVSEEDSSYRAKGPFSDPVLFQEGLKELTHVDPPPPPPEKPAVAREIERYVSEPSVDSDLFKPISPVPEYETDYVPQVIDTSVSREPFGTIDKAHIPPIEEVISRLETPAESEKPPPSVVVDIPMDGSVRESVSRFESADNSPDTSRRASALFETSPLDSKRSSWSEFGLSKGLTDKDRKRLRTLEEIQADLVRNGVPREEWTQPLNIKPKKRPLSMTKDIGDRRHGKIVSVEEKDLLDKMMLEQMREESKEESISNTGSILKAPSAVDSLKILKAKHI